MPVSVWQISFWIVARLECFNAGSLFYNPCLCGQWPAKLGVSTDLGMVGCAVFLLSSCIVVCYFRWYPLDCEKVCWWVVFLFEVTNCVLINVWCGIFSEDGVISCVIAPHVLFDSVSNTSVILFESFCDLSQWTLLWLMWVAVTYQWLVSVTETLM